MGRSVSPSTAIPFLLWLDRCLPRNRRRTDGFHTVSIKRLRAIVGSDVDSDAETVSGQLEALAHYTCPSLAHFIALLCRPIDSCVPQNTSLIIVDSLSALVNHAFPKAPDGRVPNNWKGTKGAFQMSTVV